MQAGKSIVNLPLLLGLGLSIALHVAALYGKGFPASAPAKPMQQKGRTVVQLTLLPAMASEPNPSAGDIDVAPAPTPPPPKPKVQSPKPEPQRLPAPTPPPPKPKTQSPKPKASPRSPSPEQDASLIQEKGVSTEAQATKSIAPAYPRLSRRKGEEGTVVLSVEISADGTPGNIQIVQSSGYRRLDAAALKAAQKTPFAPALRLGKAIPSTTELSFTFKLTDD